jgi:hypothetical protein
MRKFPIADTGNGDPPPKKPPTEVPSRTAPPDEQLGEPK